LEVFALFQAFKAEVVKDFRLISVTLPRASSPAGNHLSSFFRLIEKESHALCQRLAPR
jgi:hypothetical protein